MSGQDTAGRRRFRRLRALKRVRVSRRHIRRALVATTPTAALLGFGGMAVPKAAVPVAVAMTTLPTTAHALEVKAPPPAPEPPPALAPAPEPPRDLAPAPAHEAHPPLADDAEIVEASYYGAGFAGRPTANGETFDPTKLTAAHRTLPFGSLVEVTDAQTGRSVTVRINDRGPFHGDRAIDLSEAAAERIGMIKRGAGDVVLRVVSRA
jgi:rare lipoprotein A